MFRVADNVPEVYVNESRDFQLFSRLYDLAFQCSRFSIDSMETISDTLHCNDTLLPLIATKVGFFTKLKLANESDRKILCSFPYIMHYKGCMHAIELITNLFEQLMNTRVKIKQDNNDKHKIFIVFEDYTKHIELLYALVEYVRPVGLIIDYAVERELKVEQNTDYETSDKVTICKLSTNDGHGSIQPVVAECSHKECSEGECSFVSNIGFSQISIIELPKGENNSDETE